MQALLEVNGTGLDYTSLKWGIKESFRDYFERLPDHDYGLIQGTRRCADGQIEFEADLGSGAGSGTFAFRGAVILTAHHGALSVRISNPHVTLGENGAAVLSAEVDEADGRPVRMVIANLTREGCTTSRTPNLTFRAELAEEGQYLFMGNYYAGDAMDPVTIWFATS